MRYGVTARRKRNVRRVWASCRRLRKAAPRARGAAGSVSMAVTEGGAVRHAGDRGQAHLQEPSANASIVARFLASASCAATGVGIVGPNGAGKTTLVNLLTGVLAPDSGNVQLGANVEMATLDQSRESLDPESTLRRGADRRRRRHS